MRPGFRSCPPISSRNLTGWSTCRGPSGIPRRPKMAAAGTEVEEKIKNQSKVRKACVRTCLRLEFKARVLSTTVKLFLEQHFLSCRSAAVYRSPSNRSKTNAYLIQKLKTPFAELIADRCRPSLYWWLLFFERSSEMSARRCFGFGLGLVLAALSPAFGQAPSQVPQQDAREIMAVTYPEGKTVSVKLAGTSRLPRAKGERSEERRVGKTL